MINKELFIKFMEHHEVNIMEGESFCSTQPCMDCSVLKECRDLGEKLQKTGYNVLDSEDIEFIRDEYPELML